ncbi:MAG: UbiD family decarboxylase [Planctomycetota bacterium]
MISHRSTRDAVVDLKKNGRLIEIDTPLSPRLEIAEIQRRVYARKGPAVLFTNPVNTRFPMVSNLFGSLDQARFLFRHTLDRVRRAIELKIDPNALFRNPLRYISAPSTAWAMLPKRTSSGPVLSHSCEISDLPHLVSWPNDGGPFVTLPQVLSTPPIDGVSASPKLTACNLGMYRIQLSGNQYVTNKEIGLHYQLHRGIGIHHQQALKANKPFPVTITVGGTPAMTLAAVMPLPEDVGELTFAGALAGHRIRMIVNHASSSSSLPTAPIYADADFAITGIIDPESLKPEGPFGDHLGYYALTHPFPWMQVTGVYHRPDAIWPFTVVGRPPQEDTTFGELIHEITGPIIPTVLPGVRGVHAVDVAGVHPLLLAIGSERYTPYLKPNRPQELMTQASAILGQGQMSLAKYLLIIDGNDSNAPSLYDLEAFFRWIWERIDFSRDLHFLTKTTIDTLDYSGEGWNQGSKLIVPITGPKRRDLITAIPSDFKLNTNFSNPKLCYPGVIAIETKLPLDAAVEQLSAPMIDEPSRRNGIALITLVDNADFTSRSMDNWTWVTFTRSNPAIDLRGVGEKIENKHWSCSGPLIIDARIKPHHAPPLVESPEVTKKIDALAAKGGPLAKYL